MGDETRNDRQNANRNPGWWGDFSQLVEIEKLIYWYLAVQIQIEILIEFEFFCISQYNFKL